jgi:hypothetical protein
MKILLLGLAALAGCKSAPVFHVTTVDPCAAVSANVTFAGKEYALSVDAPPLGVACPSPLRPEDVGKDLPATLDIERGVFTITTPWMGPSRYAVSAAREVAKDERLSY